MKYLLLGLGLLLSGCLLDAPSGPRLIGYAFECDSACRAQGIPYGDFEKWPLRVDTTKDNPFFVYGAQKDLNAGKLGDGTRRALQSFPKNTPIYDMGGGCLSFAQSGKDTLIISGRKLAVEVPLEPCFPYSLTAH